ncbi:MAG TPA: site-2 protease family protein [Longimicrobium sp.]
MRWAYPVARVAGTQVRVHVTFLLLLMLIAAGAWSSGGAEGAVRGTTFILLLFLSVLLHELGHAAAARRYGIATPFIILLPIGGIAAMQGMPRQPRRELTVAMAGPAVNVAIALAIAASLRLSGGDATPFAAAPGEPVSLAVSLMNANIALVLFNLLPAFPMDGGRMLRAGLAMRMDYVRATRVAATTGQVFALLLGMIGLLGNPLLLLIALVVYLGAGQEAEMVRMQAITARYPAAAAMATGLRTLVPDAGLHDARGPLLHSAQDVFPVVDDAGRLEGIVTAADLVSALGRGGAHHLIRSLLRADVPSIRGTEPLDQAVRRMGESHAPALLVTGDDGHLLGVVTPLTVARLVAMEGAGATRPPEAVPLAPTVPAPAHG